VGLVGISQPPHSLLDHKEVVRFSEYEHVRGGDGSTVSERKLHVVDAGHVKGGGWLPCSSAGGEGEDVHEAAGRVGPLADGLYFTEEEPGEVIRPSRVTVEG